MAIRDFQQLGMTYRSHHAFVWESHHIPFNLAANFDYEYFARLTDWLANHNITAYSVHAGSYKTGTDKKEAYTRFLKNVCQLEKLCCDRNIILGVETMYATPPGNPSQNLLDNAADIKQFCQDIAAIKLVIDLAHLNIWHQNNVTEKIEVLTLPIHNILEIHISDNDGKRDIHSPITETTWWLPWINLLPLSVPIILESRMNYLPFQEIKQNYNRVLALFDKKKSIIDELYHQA